MITGYLKPRREVPEVPPPHYSQDELRDRRRKRLVFTLDGEFDLTAEVLALTQPLAQRIAAEPNPAGYLTLVEAVADAVFQLHTVAADLLADRDAARHLGHIRPGDRDRARRAMRALSARPVRSEITGSDLVAGTWSTPLGELAAPFSDALSDLLSRAATDRRGAPSASDQIVEALRDVDAALRSADRKIDRLQTYRAAHVRPTHPDVTDHRNTLRELGIRL